MRNATIPLSICALALGLVWTSGPAQAEVTANIGVVSNYFFRGFSESDGQAAVQGGLDYEAESGFYAGTWVSNVDYDDGTSYELDFYAGYGGEFGNGLGYSVGYIYYAYPDAPDDFDFGEINGELSYGAFSGGLSMVVNDSAAAALENGDLYFYLGADTEVGKGLSAGLLVGRTAFDDGAAQDYTHYAGHLARDTEALGAFSFNLEYEDTFQQDLKAWVGWSLSF